MVASMSMHSIKEKLVRPPAILSIALMAVGTLIAQAMATTQRPPEWVSITAGVVFVATYAYAIVTLPLAFFRYLKDVERRSED